MPQYEEIRRGWAQLQPGPYVRWRKAMPGLAVLGLVMGARLLGLFQTLEWRTLDALLRWRPAEPTDERVLVIGIDEADIQRIGTYPVPDGTLAQLLQKLDQHHPRVVGIDIYRDLEVNPGHDFLVETLDALPYVIGIEKLLNNPVAPPPSLPAERVGFVDFPLDDDGFVRRSLLGTVDSQNRYHFSLAIQLTKTYLAEENLRLSNGRRDPSAMQFGNTEFIQFQPNSGGYIQADAGGNQVLLNVRSGPDPFRRVSFSQVMDGEVDPNWIEDAIVLIGMTSLSTKDLLNSAAVVSENPGLVYGVDMQAHATSQLVNAVLEGRPLLKTLPDAGEYLWILFWGGVGMILVRRFSSPSWYLLVMGLTGLGLVSLSYGVLWLGGWWIPLVPTLVAFSVNGLVLPGFYLYDQVLRSRIEERQRVIEQTYDAIHNGPLQTLALLLRDSGETLDWSQALPKLHHLNQDLRAIYENLLKESTLHKETSLHPEGQALSASAASQKPVPTPLHEQLYEIYNNTLQRDFPGFQSLRCKIVKFEPLATHDLASDDLQALCRFFEETLCNVGKHAVEATRLTIICCATDTENLIQVKDNGKPAARAPSVSPSVSGGRGTQQAQKLARRLQGQFQRVATNPGMMCELRWPLHPQKQHFLKWWLSG